MLVGLFISSLKELSLFDIMLQTGSLIQMPILIPLTLAIIIKRVPDWAPWATVLVGLCVSLLSKFVLTADMIGGVLGIEFTGREGADLLFILSMFLHLTVTMGFFFYTRRIYRGLTEARTREVDAFFTDIETPVVSRELGATAADLEQRNKLGILAMVYGACIFLLLLVPQPEGSTGAVMGFVVTGGIVLGIGCLLKLSARAKLVQRVEPLQSELG